MDELFAKEGEVTAADREALVAAIKSGYPNRAFFYLRLANKWAINVDDDITPVAQAGTLVVTAIVAYAASQGRTLDLLALAWTDAPGNPALKAMADRFLPDQQGVLAKYGPAVVQPGTPPALKPSLEKLVEKRSRLIDIVAFQRGLANLAGALCRIATPEVQGTGFLIGRRTVLTNFHVMKDAIGAGLDGAKITCEFDYHGDGQPSVKLPVAAGLGWKGPSSTYSQSDLSGTGEPAAGELDFAVVHLAADVEPGRTALKWPIAPPIVSQRDFVVIGQHPGGHEAKVAVGEVLEYPGSGLRYRYDVTTKPGSSGSPVLDMSLDLVALHHAGDPGQNPQYNQGVPIWLIMKALQAAGLDLAAL